MPLKWMKKQPKPRRMGEIEPVQVNESLSGFITLSLGKDTSERLLKTSDPKVLRWVAANALLATQAQKIREQYHLVESDLDATGKISAAGIEEAEKPESSVTQPPAVDNESVLRVSDGSEVSFHSIHISIPERIRDTGYTLMSPFIRQSYGSSTTTPQAQSEIESIKH